MHSRSSRHGTSYVTGEAGRNKKEHIQAVF